jgi:hypothetical protein
MWGVDPKVLCTRHLSGEHAEMHMFAGTIKKGIHLTGYIQKGEVETDKIKERHDELAAELSRRTQELLNRGIKLKKTRSIEHKSPMNENPFYPEIGKIDRFKNLQNLRDRCPVCAKLQAEKSMKENPESW